MAITPSDTRTPYILHKQYGQEGCHICHSNKHSHLTCTIRQRPDAAASKCKAILAARDKESRRWAFLRWREVDGFDATVHPVRLTFHNEQFDCRVVWGVQRYHEKRIICAEWHPSGRFVVTGDAGGALKVLQVGDAANGRYFDASPLPQSCRGASCVHQSHVRDLDFDDREEDLVYSGGGDGVVYATRLGLCQGARRRDRTECVRERTLVARLNHIGSELPGGRRVVWSVAYDSKSKMLYVGDKFGEISRQDPREDASASAETYLRFHSDKIASVHVNPVNNNLIATASYDCKLRLWDARKLSPAHAIGVYKHRGGICSAYFSPSTGSRLLATSVDNTFQIWRDVHAFVGDVNARSDATPVAIKHSHNFEGPLRHLNAFKGVWDPKDWKDDLFICGRYTSQLYAENAQEASGKLLHPIDLFSANAAAVTHSLIDPASEFICHTNKFSPVSNCILSVASGEVILWAPTARDGANRSGELVASGATQDSSDSATEELDYFKQKRYLKALPTVTKRRGRTTLRRKGSS